MFFKRFILVALVILLIGTYSLYSQEVLEDSTDFYSKCEHVYTFPQLSPGVPTGNLSIIDLSFSSNNMGIVYIDNLYSWQFFSSSDGGETWDLADTVSKMPIYERKKHPPTVRGVACDDDGNYVLTTRDYAGIASPELGSDTGYVFISNNYGKEMEYLQLLDGMNTNDVVSIGNGEFLITAYDINDNDTGNAHLIILNAIDKTTRKINTLENIKEVYNIYEIENNYYAVEVKFMNDSTKLAMTQDFENWEYFNMPFGFNIGRTVVKSKNEAYFISNFRNSIFDGKEKSGFNFVSTKDGGKSWEIVNSYFIDDELDESLFSVGRLYSPSKNVFFILPSSSPLIFNFMSFDGGNNWYEISKKVTRNFLKAYIASKNLVYLYSNGIGFKNEIYKFSFNNPTTSVLPKITEETGKCAIYPNPLPASEQLKILIPSTFPVGDKAIKIYDINGRLLSSQKLNNGYGEFTLNIPNLSRGKYLLQINSDKVIQNLNLIIE